MPTALALNLAVTDPWSAAVPEVSTWPVLVTSQYVPAGPDTLAVVRALLTRAKVAPVARPATLATTM